MKFLNKTPLYVDYLLMIAGTAIMAFGIKCIYDPVGLVTGGFTGIAIVLKQATQSVFHGGMPLWLANTVLNIPIFLLSWRMMGRRFIGRTVFSTLLLSFWLYLIPAWDIAQGDFTISAIFGGGISGVGIGMVLLAKATTGGTDMVAALIQKKLRHYSIVQILQVVDGAIVILGLYVFGLKAALYSIVAIFIVTKVSDALMEGLKYSKGAFIITSKYKEVADSIIHELDRGVTALDATGMYSGEKRIMLYCVVSKKEIIQLKDLIAEIDPGAFVIVSDAREVLGEGFIEYSN